MERAARGVRDRNAWHDAYDDPGSAQSRRLAVVQRYIRESLDWAGPGPIRMVSICAAQGRDLPGDQRDQAARDAAVVWTRPGVRVFTFVGSRGRPRRTGSSKPDSFRIGSTTLGHWHRPAAC
ncbi:hypothetical protein Acsp03_31740 [Actinomadura sp. NBRC 104412]|nr:hypothetical protein Acsp03_31740 [Actinomadura sp. NBRC 104412]